MARRTLAVALATTLSGLVLYGALPVAAYAQQETGGMIVIPGNGEKNPADAQALAARIEMTPSRSAAPAGATLASLRPTPAAQRAANVAEGQIVIAGNGEESGQAAAVSYATSGVQGAPGARAGAVYGAANGSAYGTINGTLNAASGNATTGMANNPTGNMTIGRAPAMGMPAAMQRVNLPNGARQLASVAPIAPVAVGSAPVRYTMPSAQNQPAVSKPYASSTAASAADASAPIEIEPLAARGEPPQLTGAGGSTAAVKAPAPAPAPVARPAQAISAQAVQAAQTRALQVAQIAQAMQPTQAAQAAQAANQKPQQLAAAQQLAQAQAMRTNQRGVADQRVVAVNAGNAGSAAANPAALAASGALPAGQQDADSINATAYAFLQQQTAGLPGKITITVAPAFPRGLAACTTLEPFMPVGARLWGRTSVGVRCAGARPWTIYLRASISLMATYYSSARQISPGEMLSAADLVAHEGDLALLPQAVITDPAQAVGAIALARIGAGLPLRQDLLKSAMSVTVGQTVKVVAAGEGFSISAEGSVMNNAGPGQQVRVKTSTGQIVTGIVKDGSTVEIQL